MNEDWMTELEPRPGDALERKLDRYARVRLEPSAAQAKRARTAVMEAAWRQRIAADGSVEGVPGAVASVVPEAVMSGAWGPTPSALASRTVANRWSVRRLGVSMAAAVIAGLLVGSTTFAASRAGGPLYDTRLALEELTLPSDVQARLEAELGLAQVRLAEILDAVARDDGNAVEASVRGYLAALDDLSGSTAGPADRAVLAIEGHRAILLDVLNRVPDDARAGVETALDRSALVIERLDAAGTKPTTGGGGVGKGVGNAGGTNAGGNGAGPNGNNAGGNGAGPNGNNAGGNGAGPNGNAGGNDGGANGNNAGGNDGGAKPSKDPQPARTSAPTPDTGTPGGATPDPVASDRAGAKP